MNETVSFVLCVMPCIFEFFARAETSMDLRFFSFGGDDKIPPEMEIETATVWLPLFSFTMIGIPFLSLLSFIVLAEFA